MAMMRDSENGRGCNTVELSIHWAVGESLSQTIKIMSTRLPKGCSVFLIEDEAMIRMMVADMLQELGYHVAGEAPRVDEAIDLVQKTHFDLAIIDVNLHGEMVFPVAEAIKASNRPFIFATGYNASILPTEFRDRPALQKSFQIETLGKFIEDTLRNHRP
jgi:CheY-like chemotaxis protein